MAAPELYRKSNTLHMSVERKVTEYSSTHSTPTTVYDGQYTWTIKGQLLNDVLHAKVGQRFKSETFNIISIGNSRWQIELHPTGWEKKYAGYSTVYLSLLSMPQSWNEIIICRTIKCIQTESSLSKIVSYKPSQSRGWIYALPFDEIKHSNLSKVEFMITIKTLQIKQQETNIYHNLLSINYQKQQQINLQIDEDMMQKLKYCKPGKRIESKLFNSIWCISICPNGNIPANKGKCVVSLCLCCLPSNISKWKVKMNIKCDGMKQKAITHEFSIKHSNKEWNEGTFDRFKKLDSFNMIIDVLIQKEYDQNGDEIEIDHCEEECKERAISMGEKFDALKQNMAEMNNKLEELMKSNKKKDEEITRLNNQLLEEKKQNEMNNDSVLKELNTLKKKKY
eukprot:355099_1